MKLNIKLLLSLLIATSFNPLAAWFWVDAEVAAAKKSLAEADDLWAKTNSNAGVNSDLETSQESSANIDDLWTKTSTAVTIATKNLYDVSAEFLKNRANFIQSIPGSVKTHEAFSKKWVCENKTDLIIWTTVAATVVIATFLIKKSKKRSNKIS